MGEDAGTKSQVTLPSALSPDQHWLCQMQVPDSRGNGNRGRPARSNNKASADQAVADNSYRSRGGQGNGTPIEDYGVAVTMSVWT